MLLAADDVCLPRGGDAPFGDEPEAAGTVADAAWKANVVDETVLGKSGHHPLIQERDSDRHGVGGPKISGGHGTVPIGPEQIRSEMSDGLLFLPEFEDLGDSQ